MMRQRTCNIIMCCKGHCNIGGAKGLNHIQSIIKYMSKECAVDERYYTSILIEGLLREALFNYFEVCDSPSYELSQLLKSYVTSEPSLTERICDLFQLINIMDCSRYVNGFTDELIKRSEKDLETITEN